MFGCYSANSTRKVKKRVTITLTLTHTPHLKKANNNNGGGGNNDNNETFIDTKRKDASKCFGREFLGCLLRCAAICCCCCSLLLFTFLRNVSMFLYFEFDFVLHLILVSPIPHAFLPFVLRKSQVLFDSVQITFKKLLLKEVKKNNQLRFESKYFMSSKMK